MTEGFGTGTICQTMNENSFSSRLGFACALFGLVLPLSKAAKLERPNFIIIFCDDLGYADIGPFGSDKHSTPSLDRMTAVGRKLTSFYVTSDDLTGAKGSGTREPGFIQNAKPLTRRK